jgi:hypothetical protein
MRSASSRELGRSRASRGRTLLAIAASSAAVLLVSGCDKAVAPSETLPALEPSSTESSAGTWRMIELTGPTQFTVAAPTSITSAAYVAEVDAIKTAQSRLTSEQRDVIAYWSGGGVMRWNQILRELVARYNLPPAPRDGAYPIPDAENPFGDPAFPFANPMYAARALKLRERCAIRRAESRLVLEVSVEPAVAGQGRTTA